VREGEKGGKGKDMERKDILPRTAKGAPLILASTPTMALSHLPVVSPEDFKYRLSNATGCLLLRLKSSVGRTVVAQG
jgi:hypothetical protein